jgi:hypothetical protein
MLDLILFSSCVGMTKFISNTHMMSPAAPPSSIGTIHKSPSEHFTESYGDQGHLLYRASRTIFQMTLLLSLWLFCLSILEAAPASWLLFINDTSSFVQCYRINLWTLCILLEVAIPTVLGVLLVVKLAGYEAITFSGIILSPVASPSKASKSPRSKASERLDSNKLLLLFRVLWVGARFCLAAVWYILMRFISILIPSTVLNRGQSSSIRSNGDSCIRNSRVKCCCSPKVALPVLFALLVSFGMLQHLSTIVISDTGNGSYLEDGSIPTNTKHKHKLGQYCLWVTGPHSPLKFCVKMACALGMIIASLLNGFGCASMPHANLVGMYLKPTSAAVLAKVEEDFFYAAQNLEEKKYMMAGLLQLSSSANVPTDNIKIKQLKEEISFLENLVGDMSDDIEEMKHSQKLALRARTATGRISWILGVIFSIILVFRVVVAASSFINGSKGLQSKVQRRDPITMMILWLAGHHIVNDEQYNLYLQGTSLILAGFLTVSQIRNFFRAISLLGRKLSQLIGISLDTTKSRRGISELSMLMCSFVMGCYFLSCVVVVKMTLPLEYRAAFSESMGKFDFGFNTAVLNILFCTSTCTSALILGFMFGIQRNNSERYNVESTISSKGSFSQDSASHTA